MGKRRKRNSTEKFDTYECERISTQAIRDSEMLRKKDVKIAVVSESHAKDD